MLTYRIIGGLFALLGAMSLLGGAPSVGLILLGIGVFFFVVVPELRIRDRADEE